MNVYPLNVNTPEDMKSVCARIGTDPRALKYLVPKANTLHIYAENIDYRAAGFLKQEMLARGGDVAVTKHVIDGKAEKSNVLIMSTQTQLRSLQEKLRSMDIWGIKELREKLSEVMKSLSVREWEMTSPNGHTISLSMNTKIMAVLNVTPDSFNASSRVDANNILERAEACLNDGAYILDVGAESTRPGALRISESEEVARLLPALRALRREFADAVISVDTYKPETARIAVSEGADIINDVSGFTFGGNMPEVVAELGVPYVLSHIKGTPENMRSLEGSNDIVSEVVNYFEEKLGVLDGAGVKREQVIIDPGLGFGKDEDENFALLRDVESMRVWGLPVMVGHSRKRFVDGSLAGTLGVSALVSGRVSVVRVHDVKENAEALRVGARFRSV